MVGITMSNKTEFGKALVYQSTMKASGVDDDAKPHGAQTPQTSRARGRQSVSPYAAQRPAG